jgi:hypothetical protein
MKDILKSEQGKTSEGRLFAILGKGVALWMLIAFAESVINQEWILGILLATLIAPKLFEKVLYLRAGGKDV